MEIVTEIIPTLIQNYDWATLLLNDTPLALIYFQTTNNATNVGTKCKNLLQKNDKV